MVDPLKYHNICPFKISHYGTFHLFLVLFTFGRHTPKERKCISERCALWSPEHSICSFRLLGK